MASNDQQSGRSRTGSGIVLVGRKIIKMFLKIREPDRKRSKLFIWIQARVWLKCNKKQKRQTYSAWIFGTVPTKIRGKTSCNQQSDAIEGEAQCTCRVQQVLKNVTFTPSHQRIFIKILIFKNNLAMRSRWLRGHVL